MAGALVDVASELLAWLLVAAAIAVPMVAYGEHRARQERRRCARDRVRILRALHRLREADR